MPRTGLSGRTGRRVTGAGLLTRAGTKVTPAVAGRASSSQSGPWLNSFSRNRSPIRDRVDGEQVQAIAPRAPAVRSKVTTDCPLAHRSWLPSVEKARAEAD